MEDGFYQMLFCTYWEYIQFFSLINCQYGKNVDFLMLNWHLEKYVGKSGYRHMYGYGYDINKDHNIWWLRGG